MNYKETIDYLFDIAPLFQQKGSKAYKEGLYNTEALDKHFGHPHQSYRTIHVGGTNGKGSTAHTLAAILQAEGYKVGLYTSPHLLDFRERIRVNGEMISEQRVIDFVAEERVFFEPLAPSFFELTTALALLYFAEEKVDFAIIEVGLGGRLDCTNIITPLLSVITNISFDHTQFLGTTLADIAYEKAGIIKPKVPVVIGEKLPDTIPVFKKKAQEIESAIFFAEDEKWVMGSAKKNNGAYYYETRNIPQLQTALIGRCQEKNANTILSAIAHLPFPISEQAIRQGFSQVEKLTGLQGRWQVVETNPLTICDTGHNVGGWHFLSGQLQEFIAEHRQLHVVFGMVNDKEVSTILTLLPKEARYYFTQANVERAKPANEIAQEAYKKGLRGDVFTSVRDAFTTAKDQADINDVIYIGGSTFIVADFLAQKQLIDDATARSSV